MTMVHRGCDKSTPEPTALTTDSKAVAGGFTRLNPIDGLFLKAEHLNRMQDYTADLAAAVGAGLGPGVAYGYTCTLSGDTVEVSAGLGFAAGRPLRSRQTVSISLTDLTASELDFWVVEIVPKTWEFGSEPVYGGLCEDPCGKGSGISPYQAEGIELRLRPDSLDKAPGAAYLRRNRLASYFFERERRYGGEFEPSANAPWLLPASPGGPVMPLSTHEWAHGTGPHDYAALPLAVVWKEHEQWRIDTWIARRDVGVSTPSAAWQWRLGWRPRNVLIAQVLQFQAQLAKSPFGPTVGMTPKWQDMYDKAQETLLHIRRLSDIIDKAGSADAGIAVSVGRDAARLSDMVPALIAELAPQVGGAESWLQAAGFDELPPAGYVPFAFGSGQEDRQARAYQIFGAGVDVRVRVCRADFVAHAVEQAQHTDRIPLTAPQGRIPEIDLLVPDATLVDLNATVPRDSYGWAAFVRRRDPVVPEPAQQEVDVYLVRPGIPGVAGQALSVPTILHAIGLDGVGDLEKLLRQRRGRERFELVGTVTYPSDTWALPIHADEAWKMVRPDPDEGLAITGVLGVVNKLERQPLAAVRASLFVTPPNNVNNDPIRIPTTYVLAADAPEAIVVVLLPREQDHG